MRKTGRIVTLVLAVVTIVLSVISAKNHLLRIVSIIIHIIQEGFGPIEKNQLFFNAIYALVAISAIYFAIIYLVYTLKNGLGTELYSWSKEKHMQYLEERKEKKLLKQQNKKEKLQKELEKLNTESDK